MSHNRNIPGIINNAAIIFNISPDIIKYTKSSFPRIP